MVLSDRQIPAWQEPVRVSFDTGTGYLVLQLNPDEYGYVKQAVRFREQVFEPKDELHITILSRDAADAVKTFTKQQPEDDGRVREVVETTRWSYRKLPVFYHVVEEPGAETIIQMVEVQFLGEFFRHLSAVLHQDFLLPPTHVTLYMRGTEKGIGLPTQESFNRLVRSDVLPDDVNPLSGSEDRGPA